MPVLGFGKLIMGRLRVLFLSEKNRVEPGSTSYVPGGPCLFWGPPFPVPPRGLLTAGPPLIFLRVVLSSRTHYWRTFSKFRQSTAFYCAHRTIFCAKAMLSRTYFFFASKSEKQLSKSEIQKHIFKIKSARNKIGKNHSSTIQAPFLPWTMTEN